MLKMPAVLQILPEKFGCLPKSAYLCTRKQENDRGVEQLVARQAHNLEVVRSSRASATYAAHLRQDNLHGVQPNSGLCSIFFVIIIPPRWSAFACKTPSCKAPTFPSAALPTVSTPIATTQKKPSRNNPAPSGLPLPDRSRGPKAAISQKDCAIIGAVLFFVQCVCLALPVAYRARHRGAILIVSLSVSVFQCRVGDTKKGNGRETIAFFIVVTHAGFKPATF